jgi:hypothetical protein
MCLTVRPEVTVDTALIVRVRSLNSPMPSWTEEARTEQTGGDRMRIVTRLCEHGVENGQTGLHHIHAAGDLSPYFEERGTRWSTSWCLSHGCCRPRHLLFSLLNTPVPRWSIAVEAWRCPALPDRACGHHLAAGLMPITMWHAQGLEKVLFWCDTYHA